jgi:two-component system chemotaxis sensor kinase CheA
VELADGITPQDIKLFLTEADEQLQLLDEDIVRLERESGNVKLLQEIFRASHTIKGSSAMIGHQRMSHLAHGMENILDKVRKGTLPVSSLVVDALLKGLDGLRILREELVTGEESQADINTVLLDLEAAILNGEINPEAAAPASELPLDNESKAELESAHSRGERGFQIKVAVNKDTSWVAVRCFQIVQELSKIGTVVKSNPSLSDIEAGKTGSHLELLVTTTGDEKSVKEALVDVPELDSVAVSLCASEQPASPEKIEAATAEHSMPAVDIAAPAVAGKPAIPAAVSAPASAEKPAAAGGETNSVRKEDMAVKQTIRVDVSRLDTLMEQIGELVINRNHIGQISKILAEKYQDDEMIRTLSDSVSQTGKIVNILQQDIMTIRMLPIELVFNTMPRMVRDLARKIGKKVDFIVEGQETEVDRSVIEHLRDPLIHLLRNSVDHGMESPEERLAAGKPEMGTIRLSAHHEQDHIVITVSDDGRGIDPELVKAASIRKGVISPEAAARLTDTELMNLIMASGVSTAKTITEVSGRGVGLDIVKKNIEFLNDKINVESTIGKGSTFTLQLPLTLAIIPTLLVSLGKTVYAIPLATIVEAIKLESKEIKTVRGKEVTLYRNRVLPLLRLNTIFKWNSANTGTSGLNHIVIVKACEMQVGIIVDELIGQQEIVVKSLDQFIGGADGLSGASILGDGQVVLILDVNSLVKSTIAESQNAKDEKEQNGIPVLAAAR